MSMVAPAATGEAVGELAGHHDENGRRKSLVVMGTRVVEAGEQDSPSLDDPTGHHGEVGSHHLVDPSMRRSSLGAALRATQGHYLMLVPILENVQVHDSWTVNDSPARLPIYRFLNALNIVSLVVSIVGVFSLPFWGPFAVFSYTGAARMYSEGNGTTFPFADISGASTALAAHDVFTAALTYTLLYLHTLLSLGVLRMLWLQNKARLLATIGSSFLYSIVATSLLPNRRHIHWLVARTLVVSFVCLTDAFTSNYKLRLTPQRFKKLFGSSGGHGIISLIVAACFVVFAVGDTGRHMLVIFVAQPTVLIDFGITHPSKTSVNFALSDLQIADAVFFTSVIYLVSTVYHIMKSHFGAETVFLTTRFRVE